MMFSLSGNKVSLADKRVVSLEPKKPTYAFDIDGVLCNTKDAHKAELERELGVTLEDGGHYHHFGFHHEDQATLDAVAKIALDLWRRPTVFTNGTADGQGVLHQLRERGQLAGYVTRRHPHLTGKTGMWLSDKVFPMSCHHLFDESADDAQIAERSIDQLRAVYQDEFPYLHHMLGDTDSKAGPARAMGADTLVEDSPTEALLAARDGLKVVVLRAGYNAAFEQECKAIRITRGSESIVRGRISYISTLEELL